MKVTIKRISLENNLRVSLSAKLPYLWMTSKLKIWKMCKSKRLSNRQSVNIKMFLKRNNLFLISKMFFQRVNLKLQNPKLNIRRTIKRRIIKRVSNKACLRNAKLSRGPHKNI